MGQRSSGVTALALLATVQGIYGFVAAIALLFGGTLGMFVEAPTGVTTTVIGALFLALSLTSSGLGAGLHFIANPEVFGRLKHWLSERLR